MLWVYSSISIKRFATGFLCMFAKGFEDPYRTFGPTVEDLGG
jgi:hypothetical protein